MVRALKVRKEKGQQAIEWLRNKGWLNTEHRLGKTQQYLIIPLNDSARADAIAEPSAKDAKEFASVLKKFSGKIETKNLQKIKKSSGDLKDKLAKVVPKKYLSKVNRSFDMVGTIAILDVPKGLEKIEKSIAWTLLRSTPNVKTVAKRASITSGKYRIRKIKVLVGDKTTETIHIENGIRLKLDINEAYFTPRWVTERRRIANLVKPRENVLVMFAGVGPFSLAITKLQPKVGKVTSVEINPAACKYLEENIRLNCNIYAAGKASGSSKRAARAKPAIALMQEKHDVFCGDVAKIVPTLRGKFDRVLMPLPKTAIEFLELAIKKTKKGGTVHFYTFAGEKELASLKRKLVKQYKVRLLRTVICGAYAPGVDRYCFDLKVL